MTNEKDDDNLHEPAPNPRDELRRQHDRERMRPRNLALDQHGPQIEAEIEREPERRRKKGKTGPQTLPRRGGLDMDKE